MAGRGIKGVSTPTSVPSGQQRAQMVLGSRTPDMYSPRVKPLAPSTRDYGKKKQQPAGSDPTGLSVSTYGNTP